MLQFEYFIFTIHKPKAGKTNIKEEKLIRPLKSWNNETQVYLKLSIIHLKGTKEWPCDRCNYYPTLTKTPTSYPNCCTWIEFLPSKWDNKQYVDLDLIHWISLNKFCLHCQYPISLLSHRDCTLPSAHNLSSSPHHETKDIEHLPDSVEQCSLYLPASFPKMLCSS